MEVYIKALNQFYGQQLKKQLLADAEVEYMDHTSNTIYVAFKIKETKKIFKRCKCYYLDNNTMDNTS